jgi:Protein of unknown function (DUF3119)
MTSATSKILEFETVELAPSYKIAIFVVALGLGLSFLQLVVGAGVALFGVFLLIQTVVLRLRFTPVALDVYRGETMIRSFPYSEWSHWEIFWRPVPILFYFREVKSIHFLPIIFDPRQLEACLVARCTRMDG